jgi:two-component system OmpR family response regulator/two-component system response regulator QseB
VDEAQVQARLVRMRAVDRRWASHTAPTVIVVEPHAGESARAEDRLRSVGISARVFQRGGPALVELGRGDLDAALVATGTTDISCHDWLTAARQATPVPIVVGVGAEQPTEVGPLLMAGATAVVDHPFDAAEVADALQWAWERARPRAASRGHLTVGPLELDAPSFSARLAGEELALTLGGFELLWALMLRANRVVSPEEISRSLSASPPGSTAHVKARIARLRAELGAPGLIRTVRGQGYTVRHLLHGERSAETADLQPSAHP